MDVVVNGDHKAQALPLKLSSPPEPTASQSKPDSDQHNWTQLFVLVFLSFNLATAIYRSLDDHWTLAFIVFAYLDLLLLFWCLRMLEKVPQGSSRRSRLKVAVWLLSTTLTVTFSYQVALIMPLAVKAVVWGMAGLSISAGFYALFVYRDDNDKVAISQEPHLLV